MRNFYLCKSNKRGFGEFQAKEKAHAYAIAFNGSYRTRTLSRPKMSFQVLPTFTCAILVLQAQRMITDASGLDKVRSRLFTNAGRYSGATLLTLLSVGCLTLSYRPVDWRVRVLCVAIGLSLPSGIAWLMPSKLRDPDQELSHRSYWSRLGFSYLYVVVIAIALMLILPLVGLFLLGLFGHSGLGM